jgi:hypothetical protein
MKLLLHLLTSLHGRLCCKSLFALVIKNSPGFRRDLRVKMWGTSSPDDKLTGDLGNVIEITQVGGSRSDRLTARKSSPGNFGLLQHNRHEADVPARSNDVCSWGKTGRHMLVESLRAVFGSIHRTCLSPLVTDRVMEAWYHPSIA